MSPGTNECTYVFCRVSMRVPFWFFWLDDKVSMSIPSVYPALHSFWSSWDNVSH
ncbi:unnamed protein product [Acanthoscelides obtectus]|uniref:Uncharacterized protein n=1 Tax=Acanthoscelides obtectus TaxID=200917 RepID=A0A9P0JR90_ACAOB|nr:unnamed protein product [Acanthoscelides obtectus]CAK1679147.1 hypothetical protein AOBTE_LOCUS32146 [Acanthoscelides obtectus]